MDFLAAGYLSPVLGQWLAEGPSMKQLWSDRDCFARQPGGDPFAVSRSRGGWVEPRGSVLIVLSPPVLGPLHSESFLSLFQPCQSSSARGRGCLKRESCRKTRGKSYAPEQWLFPRGRDTYKKRAYVCRDILDESRYCCQTPVG